MSNVDCPNIIGGASLSIPELVAIANRTSAATLAGNLILKYIDRAIGNSDALGKEIAGALFHRSELTGHLESWGMQITSPRCDMSENPKLQGRRVNVSKNLGTMWKLLLPEPTSPSKWAEWRNPPPIVSSSTGNRTSRDGFHRYPIAWKEGGGIQERRRPYKSIPL